MNMHIDPKDGFGWTIAWAKVSKSGEVEVQKYLTIFEEGQDLNQGLPLFANEHKAKAYLLANTPGPAPKGLKWTVAELSAYGLLVTLLDNPYIEAVDCNPHSEGARVIPATRVIEGLIRALGKPEGNAA